MVCLCNGLSDPDVTGPDAPAPVDRALRLSIMEKPAAQMSLRELKDTVENLEVEWPAFLERLPADPNAQKNLDAVLLLIDVLASQAGPLEVMDDPSPWTWPGSPTATASPTRASSAWSAPS